MKKLLLIAIVSLFSVSGFAAQGCSSSAGGGESVNHGECSGIDAYRCHNGTWRNDSACGGVAADVSINTDGVSTPQIRKKFKEASRQLRVRR
jgi:hypothetical protein